MVLGCTFRGWLSAFPQLSMPVVSTGEQEQDMLTMSAVAQKLPRVLGSQPCVTQLSFRGYKGKGFASRLHTSKPWQQLLDQTKRKEVDCGSLKQTWVSEEKTGSRRIFLRNNEEKTPAHLYGTKAHVLKKLSKLLPHPINIFFSTYGMSLSQLPPPHIPISDYA